jgi:hypothetical protein
MRRLHQVLSLKKGERKPGRRLETPSKTQAEVLSAFGYRVDTGGVLQQIDRKPRFARVCDLYRCLSVELLNKNRAFRFIGDH